MTIANINASRIAMKSLYGQAAKDRARDELFEIRRHSATMARGPIQRVMIVDRSGMDHEIKTGRPPVIKQEVREAWERAREEAKIEAMFK